MYEHSTGRGRRKLSRAQDAAARGEVELGDGGLEQNLTVAIELAVSLHSLRVHPCIAVHSLDFRESLLLDAARVDDPLLGLPYNP